MTKSLTDKVIKNTFYYLISQIVGFIFPLLLTPYIISKIGEVQFGIYALVMGFIGTFGLFDISISSSFVKFISEYYNQDKKEELNKFINTGFSLYILFSLLFTIMGFLFSGFFVSLINVPKEFVETGIIALRISLLVFFIATSFTIFVSILISIQKTYLIGISAIILGVVNLILNIIFLNINWGLTGVMLSLLIVVVISTCVNIIFVKKAIPYLSFNFKFINKESFRNMFGFGMQMQISKIAGFASEKYDEFLLGFFSVLNNVTYYNLGGKIARLGKVLPFQLYLQVAPVASELKAKNEEDKLLQLFFETTKYLLLISLPIFTFIFLFSNIIIFAWMGGRYEMAVYVLKIIIIGQVINMTISAPGNAIIPNTGIPKYSMNEGFINLGLNLILSFFLIKYYGIIGAAIGSTTAIIISSFYIFIVSVKFYKQKLIKFFIQGYIKPFIVNLISSSLSYCVYYFLGNYFSIFQNRYSAIITIVITGIVFLSSFILLITKSNYLNDRDKFIFKEIIKKIIPIREK